MRKTCDRNEVQLLSDAVQAISGEYKSNEITRCTIQTLRGVQYTSKEMLLFSKLLNYMSLLDKSLIDKLFIE